MYLLDRAGPDAQPDRLTMQSDGNLVVYSTQGEAMWASDTAGNPGAFVNFQDDGNFVIYKHAPGGKQAIFATGTDACSENNGPGRTREGQPDYTTFGN